MRKNADIFGAETLRGGNRISFVAHFHEQIIYTQTHLIDEAVGNIVISEIGMGGMFHHLIHNAFGQINAERNGAVKPVETGTVNGAELFLHIVETGDAADIRTPFGGFLFYKIGNIHYDSVSFSSFKGSFRISFEMQ